MKLLGLILKFMKNHIKLAELVYHTQRPRNEPFSEHVLFVQICLVFAGPVTIMISTDKSWILHKIGHDTCLGLEKHKQTR